MSKKVPKPDSKKPGLGEMKLLLTMVMGDDATPPKQVIDALVVGALGLSDQELVQLWLAAGELTRQHLSPKQAEKMSPVLHRDEWERFLVPLRPRLWEALKWKDTGDKKKEVSTAG